MSLEEFKDILLDAIVTRQEKEALNILQYNNYKNEPDYLEFKKTISRFVINFGLPSIINECFNQKILTFKLKIERNINAIDFTFQAGNVHMLDFIMSKGVSLHKENDDYHYLRLLTQNGRHGAEFYEYLNQNGYLKIEENTINRKYTFLDLVIYNKNIVLLAKALEDGKFKTTLSFEEIEKLLNWEKNSPYTQKSLSLLKIEFEKNNLDALLDKTPNQKSKFKI